MAADDFAPDAMGVVARSQERARTRALARGLKVDDAVLREVSGQLLERLPLLLIEPTQLLDLGCRNGYQFGELRRLYPASEITGLSLSAGDSSDQSANKKGMLNRIRSIGRPKPVGQILSGDPHALPFDDRQFDLVVSNLCLPFCQDPGAVFAEVSRVLRPGGAFLFSSLGPDTLVEYRARWSEVDSYPHVSGLIDMHDLGDAMLKASLADPVLDRSTLRLDYPSVEALEDELQAFGLVNTAYGRRRGLLTPNAMQRVRDVGSRFSVGLELVHGHAWKGELSPGRNSSNDEFRFPVSELQGSWKR